MGELDNFQLNTELLLNHILDGVVVIDEQLRVVVFNVAAEKIFGYTSDEIIGESALQLVPPSLSDSIGIILTKQLSSSHEDRRREIPSITKDQRKIIIETQTSTLFTDTGIYILSIFRDITEQKATIDQLAKEHTNNLLLLNSIGSMLIKIDDTDVIDLFNPVAERTFGVPKEQVVGKRLMEAPLSWDWKKVYKEIALKGSKHEVTHIEELKFKKPDGSKGLMEIVIHPIYDEAEDKYKGILFLGEDITKKQETAILKAQAQKLESIGELAAGIAHEINTPIQYVASNLEFLAESYQDSLEYIEKVEDMLTKLATGHGDQDSIQTLAQMKEELDFDYLVEEVPQAISQSASGMEKVATIVGAMKTFSHPSVNEKIPVDINETLDTAISISTNEWKYVAKIEKHFDPNLPITPAFPNELNHAFLNLIVNASHALEEKFSSSENHDIKGIIDISTRLTEDAIEICVSDNGNGVPEDIRDKIFDQFFTTKQAGKGTGQGLSITHAAIVMKHKGQISVTDSSMGGAKFIVKIPLKATEAAA